MVRALVPVAQGLVPVVRGPVPVAQALVPEVRALVPEVQAPAQAAWALVGRRPQQTERPELPS